MLQGTVGQIMINAALPEELRDYHRTLDKKGVGSLLREVGTRYPQKYREISKDLADLGRDFAFSTGGQSFGIKHLRPTVAAQMTRAQLGRELDAIHSQRSLSEPERNKRILAAVGKHQKTLAEESFKEAFANDNPLARQIMGAGRGNKMTLNSLIGADLLYVDHRGRPLPLPVLRSYAQGLSPAEYFAGAFGTRKGLIDLKAGTADAGYLAKKLVQLTHRLKVTALDDDRPHNPLTPRGLPVDTEDPDNEGALLAQPIGGYDRNTTLTPKIMRDLHSQGHHQILVRSPLVGGPSGGGVYGRDVGIREKGRIAPIGDWVGVSGSQSLSEPLTQGQISSKHSGGVAGANKAVGGFQYISRLVEVPERFPGTAAHSQVDGRVDNIEPAPQGGHYVSISGKKHYVAPDYPLTVKSGDSVEAGDTLSEGVAHPAEVVKHKGIGEGSRHFVNIFHQAFKDAGLPVHRRNVELLARGLINHVRLNDEIGDWAPDDVVPYHELERQWTPRPGHSTTSPESSVGRYLEEPVLHLTLGTKIRPSHLPLLKQFGVKQLTTHPESPPFEPEMIRGMANISHDPDWMTRMLGSYQQKSLLEGARRGATSDESGTSYVPAMARGVDFGRTPATKGWEPED